MNYIEYGKQNSDVIILLHGGGLSWWNYREVAEKLRSQYRIVLPILDGHAQSENDFISIENNAKELLEWIRENIGESVLMIGGLSLGAQIALEMLSQSPDICKYAFIESADVIPSKIMYKMIKPAFGSCYGLIYHRWFAKLQFKSLRMKEKYFEDYFRDSCGISRENMISFLQANTMYGMKDSIESTRAKVHIFAGGKENRKMRQSAEFIHAKINGSSLNILPELYHGEYSLNHAEDYARKVQEIVAGK